MLKEFLSNLANTFREILGTTDKINAQNFPDKVNEVYEAGKKAEYDSFWDVFQDNGNRTHYSHGFSGVGWDDENFKPKYDINVIEGERLFTSTRITDLKGILERQNVKLDTSRSVYFSQAFMASTITDVPVLDMRKHTSIGYLFHNAKSLVNVDKVILKDDGSQTLNYFATGCTALKEIRFEGVIGNNIDFKDSPLSKESITSVMNSLSPTVSGKTVTFNKNAVNTAFETDEGLGDGSTSAEWLALRATKENWTVTLV